jgi:hypothetical protein
MGYYIDLTSISIDSYKNKLQSSDLIPSRMILKENIEKRFEYFKSIEIKNIQELQQALKKKSTFSELIKVDCLSEDYLTILLREINSIHPKPNKLNEFTGVSTDVIDKLEKNGIKDTFKLFDKVKTPTTRKELAELTKINEPDILELTKLTDLSRIKWVGAMFARVLYEAGYDTVEKVTKADYNELYQKITFINKERNLYKGQIGLNDMKLCVAAAKEVPLEIEYSDNLRTDILIFN